MPEIKQTHPEWVDFQRELIRRGATYDEASRLIEEISDHQEDLVREAAEKGMTGEGAATFVRDRFGDLAGLGRRWINSRRSMTWWGRHPRVFFGLFPLLFFVLSYACGALYLGLVGEVMGWWSNQVNGISAAAWNRLTLTVPLFHFTLLMGVAFIFCRLGRLGCFGWRWPLVSCLILSLHALLHQVQFRFPLDGMDGLVFWGYGIHSNLHYITSKLWTVVPPLAVFVLYFFLAWRRDLKQLTGQASES